MKILALLALALSLMEVEAGFRCNVVFTSILSDGACKASCVVLGHTSGICDNNRECHCSQKAIDTEAFLQILPSDAIWDWSFVKVLVMPLDDVTEFATMIRE